MTDSTASDEAWFYPHSGQRKGPVPADKQTGNKTMLSGRWVSIKAFRICTDKRFENYPVATDKFLEKRSLLVD